LILACVSGEEASKAAWLERMREAAVWHPAAAQAIKGIIIQTFAFIAASF
jgi:hypothetical protein